MELTQLFTVIIALALLAEVTYLVVKLPRQNISRKQGRPILIDTSVLIDGRIIAVAQSGFIGDTLVIPRSVIGELQFLADNADHDKRARARHGLDVVKDLQAMPTVTVEILQDGSKAEEGVDERLLNLAKKHSAAVCTIDYNLNKVAVVENIQILNVNELAQSLRMAYLPGEKMLLEMIQKGQDSHQAVGYLTDGTMVVVENAAKSMGQTIEIEFIRSLQTAAGKMMFAKPTKPATDDKSSKTPKPTGKKPVEKVVKAVKQQPKQPMKKAEKPAEAVAQQTKQAVKNEQKPAETKPAETKPQQPASVYHSDDRDQRRHNNGKSGGSHQQNRRQTAPKAPQGGSTPKQSSPLQVSTRQPQQQSSKRPRTSSQREASLIDLVQNQE